MLRELARIRLRMGGSTNSSQNVLRNIVDLCGRLIDQSRTYSLAMSHIPLVESDRSGSFDGTSHQLV